MKRSLTVVLLLLVLMIPVSAEWLPVFVFDQAGLMSQGEQMELDSALQELQQSYSLNLAIVTTNTLDGKSPAQYADDYYDALFGVDSDGILFLLSMEDRDWFITTSGRGRSLLTDGEVYDSVDTALDYLSDGDYFSGFSIWVNNLPWYLENEEPEPTPSFWLSLVIGLVVAGIAVFIMTCGMNTKRQQHSARHYMTGDSYHLRTCQDFYLYSNTTRTAKPKNNSSSGGGGRSHGGGGGKF